MADPFITEQDVVDYLGRGDASDPGLAIAVEAACDICRLHSDQTFTAVQNQNRLFDGTGTDALLLRGSPVTGVSSVLVDGTAVTDYVVRDDGVMIRTLENSADEVPSYARWPEGRQNVDVTYSTGYSDSELPADVIMVAVSIAARMWAQGPTIEETIGPVRTKYAVAATDLTAGEKAILRKYKQA